MTAPTEEETRAAIAREWGRWPGKDSVAGRPVGFPIEGKFSDGIGACQRLLDGLYVTEDFRDSELARLDELTEAAVSPIRDDAARRINEAMVAVALAFAAEYPAAPRAPREATATA